MNGTAWVEPGQGAECWCNVGAIEPACPEHGGERHPSYVSGTAWTEPGKGVGIKRLRREVAGHPYSKSCLSTLGRLNDLSVAKGDSHRTNLRLTGEPLTAEDVANIARAR